MPSNHQTPINAGPALAAPAVTSAISGPSDHFQLRRPAKTGGRIRHERLRTAWYRLRLTVQEMNYATRRLVELQTRLP